MVEYAAVLQTDFAGLAAGGVQGLIDWLAGVPVYWYAATLVIFIILVKLISSRRV